MNSYSFIFSEKYRLRRHIVFWFSWWLLQAILYSYAPPLLTVSVIRRLSLTGFEALAYLLPHIFLAYSLMYVVVPKFLLNEKYLLTAISVIVLFLLTAIISACIGIFFLQKIRFFFYSENFILYQADVDKGSFFRSLLAGLRGGITIGGLAAAIKLMKILYIKEQRNLQLQKENVESQLQLLKAQVHPHFLFNTLNNIYSHTQHTSSVASRLVTGLSDMLRFILYEGSQPLVPLSKELKMVQDYIALEQVRYGNKPEIHLDIPKNTGDLYIAPLLLLPLIENCFKHGASNMLEQPWISLHLTIHDKDMNMKLLNGKVNVEMKESPPQGIGIKNVKKRLALLYPGKHSFNICNEEEVFIINLKLELQKIISVKNNISVHEKIVAYE